MPGNPRRKIRMLSQQMSDQTIVLQNTMVLLQKAGFHISNTDDIPKVVQYLLSTVQDQRQLQALPAPSATPLLDTLENLEGADTLEDEGHDIPDPTPDAWKVSPPVQSVTTASRTPPVNVPDPTAPPIDEMLAKFNAGLERMAGRVQTQGIQYGKGPAGPSAGQRAQVVLPAQPGQPPTTPPLTSQAGAPASSPTEFPELDEMPNVTPDDKINPATGMSLAQQREIIAQATGKRPDPPPGSMPNILKR